MSCLYSGTLRRIKTKIRLFGFGRELDIPTAIRTSDLTSKRMPTKKGKKPKKPTAAERERAKELWRRYFEGYDLMMMSYPERLRCAIQTSDGTF